MSSDSIIIGGNHHNTLGVIRALGYKGIQSQVILVTDEHKPFVSYSSYICKCIILRTKQEIVPYLLEYAKEIKQKAVILSCADFVTSELDNAYDKLKASFYLPTANEQGVCNHYMDKDAMAALAAKVGIGVPKSWIIKNDLKADIEEIAIPCIVKPLASIYGSKAEIKIFKDRESLRTYLSENKNHRFIVQEFIDKDFEYQLIGCSLNHGEEIVIPGYSRCIRPCPGTNTGFLEYKPFDGFKCELSACKDFIKAIGYQGLFSMEYLRDKRGNDYFLEINMRNDGNGICVTGAGVNLPYIWYLHCLGLEYRAETVMPIKDIFVMPEFDDFLCFVKTRKISCLRWIKDLRKTDLFMEFDYRDKKPFVMGIMNLFLRSIRR